MNATIAIHIQNDRLQLERLLPELLAFGSAPPLIFVLDHSQDDSLQKLKEFRETYAGSMKILENNPAVGRSACWNQALEAAETEHVLLLRPYVSPNEGAILTLSATLQDPAREVNAVVATMPALMTPRHLIANTGYVFSRALPRRADTCVPANFHRANVTQDFLALPDDALMVVRSLRFDEGLTNSYHDADLGLRIKEDGWRSVYSPSARMRTALEYAGLRPAADDIASLNAYFMKYDGLKGLDAFNNAGEYYGSGRSYPAVEMWVQNEGNPKAKVAFFICDFERDGHARGVLPARMLTLSGYDVMISTYATSSIIDWADVCVFQRQYETVVGERMAEARLKGKRVIYETDTFYHGLAITNDAAGVFVENPERLRNIEEMIYHADALVVANEELARLYGRFNTKTSIVRTGLDLGLLPKEILEGDGHTIRIGVIGTPDAELKAALADILVRHHQVRVVTFGQMDLGLSATSQRFVETCPSTHDHEDPLGDYHRQINEARLDIAVLSLESTPTARAGSDLSLVELGAFGIAIVASDVDPAQVFLKAAHHAGDVKPVLLAHCEADWRRHLERLVTTPGLRVAMGRQVQRHVWSSRGLDKTAEQLEPVIASVLAGQVHCPTKPEPVHSITAGFLNNRTAKQAAEHHRARLDAYRQMLDQAPAKVESDAPDPDEHQ